MIDCRTANEARITPDICGLPLIDGLGGEEDHPLHFFALLEGETALSSE